MHNRVGLVNRRNQRDRGQKRRGGRNADSAAGCLYNSRVQNQDRLEKLSRMLERAPDDTFLLYWLSLEHKKLGDAARAIELLDRVISLDPGYCYAYHQKGLAWESLDDQAAAQAAYRAGIEAAQRKGDAHAEEEIRAALSMIE